MQRLSIFINLWFFLTVFIAIVVLILILGMMLGSIVLVKLLLALVACRILEVLLLRPLVSRVVVSVEVDLYSWLRLYVVQHVLDVVHYSSEIEETIWLASWLTLRSHIVRYLSWLPMMCSLMVLLHPWYVRHAWYTVHKLHNVWVIWIHAVHVRICELLLLMWIVVWHPLMSIPLLVLSHVLRLVVRTSLILLLHIDVILTPLALPTRRWMLMVRAFTYSVTWVSILWAELLIHHFELGVQFLNFIVAEESFFLIDRSCLNLFLDVVVVRVLLVWILSTTSTSSPLSSWIVSILCGLILDVVFILIFSFVSLSYQIFLIDLLLVRAVFILSVHPNKLSLILLYPLLIIWVILRFISFFILRSILAFIFFDVVLNVWVDSVLMDILWLIILLALLIWLGLAMALPLMLVVVSMLTLPLQLMTLVELVADTCVIYWATLNMLKSIVVPIDFQVVCNYLFDSVVVAHHIYYVHDAKLASFWEDLVVVARYQHIGHRDSWSYFNFAIMTSQNYAVAWFHQSHAHWVIWNINWALQSTTGALHILTTASSSVCMALCWELHIWHSTLVGEGISEILLEIYSKEV